MKSIKKISIKRISTEGVSETHDDIAVEEPLEIIISYGKNTARQRKTIAVTMRTPGDDFNLALGFLFTEGVIFSRNDVVNSRYIDDNRVLVDLNENLVFDIEKLNRNFYTTSSCGVCSKASLDSVYTTSCFILKKGYPIVSKDILFKISTQLIDNQSLFKKTGGTHASIILDASPPQSPQRGEAHLPPLGGLRGAEDVGRHNALDKIIGFYFQNNALPLSDKILLVSGRASFELIQKAAMAGIPIVAAVGAPSSLAVELAEEMGMTLIGFLKQDRFNIYTGNERVS